MWPLSCWSLKACLFADTSFGKPLADCKPHHQTPIRHYYYYCIIIMILLSKYDREAVWNAKLTCASKGPYIKHFINFGEFWPLPQVWLICSMLWNGKDMTLPLPHQIYHMLFAQSLPIPQKSELCLHQPKRAFFFS